MVARSFRSRRVLLVGPWGEPTQHKPGLRRPGSCSCYVHDLGKSLFANGFASN